MSKKKKDQIEVVEQTLSKAEQFVQNNKKRLSYFLTGFLIIIVLYFASQNYYLKPQRINSSQEIFMAEKYFELDSFVHFL